MANTLRIKRRITGSAGAPSGLKNAELAYNEVDNILYYGKGDTGDGSASSIIQIAGDGAFATKTYVDTALTNSNLSQYAKLAASNTFTADYTNTFNGTVNFAGTFQIGGVTVSSSAAELNILDGVTASYDELNLLDGASAGTVVNSKAVVYSNAGAVAAASVTTTGSASVGTSFDAASNKFSVDSSANVTVGGNLTVTGNVTVNGTTTTVNSSVTTLDDPIITLGGDTAPTSNDNKDRGVEFSWHNGTAAKVGFFGYDASAARFTFIPDATNSSEVFSGTVGDIEVGSVYIGGTQVLSSTTLGSGVTGSSLTSVGTISSGTWQGTAVGVSYGGTGATNAGDARTNLGLVIGTDVQAYDAELAALAGLTSAADKLPYFTGSGTATVADFTSFGRSLVDDTDASTARTTLGLIIGTDVQAYDAELAAIAGLTSAADKLPYFTGSGTATTADFTSFGRSLVDDVDASAARTTLGLVIGTDVQAYNSTLAAVAGGTYTGDDNITTVGTISSGTWHGTAVGISYGGTGATNAGDARTNLGLVIGTDVQAYDAELAALASLTSAADRLPYFTGSGSAALATFTTFGRSLVDDTDASDARTTLGLGTIATQSASNVSITGGTIDNVIIDGGTF